MNRYPVKTPGFVKRLLPRWTWRFSKEEKVLYLTFDDGPTPVVTPWVLDTLKAYQAKATFFCIGKNARQHPALFQRLVKEGHRIGNHTDQHLNSQQSSETAYLQSIEEAEKTFQGLGLDKSGLFRPPYGLLRPKLGKKIREKGYQIVMWEVLSADFDQGISKEQCLDNVLGHAGNGSIIVFHDSVKSFQKLRHVLPATLAYFSKKGFVCKAID